MAPNDYDDGTAFGEQTSKVETFPCPKCRMVPYRKVVAKKVVSRVSIKEFGAMQVPIQRELARKFGEYLMREGLIWFTTDNTDEDFNAQMIEVVARLNVVDRNSGEVSGAERRMLSAEAEVAAPPGLLNQIARRKQGLSLREVNIFPVDEPEQVFKPEPKRLTPRERVRADREKAEAMGNRFSGLELDGDE